MKTVQELYREIMTSEELKKQAIEAAKAGRMEAFLKEHGCEATMEEVAQFLKEKSQGDASLSLDELKNAAGGECNHVTAAETFGSIFFVMGVMCAAETIRSLITGRVGQEKEGEGRLCNED